MRTGIWLSFWQHTCLITISGPVRWFSVAVKSRNSQGKIRSSQPTVSDAKGISISRTPALAISLNFSGVSPRVSSARIARFTIDFDAFSFCAQRMRLRRTYSQYIATAGNSLGGVTAYAVPFRRRNVTDPGALDGTGVCLERPAFFLNGRALFFTFFFGLIMSARLWRRTLADRNDPVRCIDQSRSICFRPSAIERRIIDVTFDQARRLAAGFRLKGSRDPV